MLFFFHHSHMGSNISRSLWSETPINHTNCPSPCNIYDNAANDTVLIASIPHLFMDQEGSQFPFAAAHIQSIMLCPLCVMNATFMGHYIGCLYPPAVPVYVKSDLCLINTCKECAWMRSYASVYLQSSRSIWEQMIFYKILVL